jgi:hypothetical protein
LNILRLLLFDLFCPLAYLVYLLVKTYRSTDMLKVIAFTFKGLSSLSFHLFIRTILIFLAFNIFIACSLLPHHQLLSLPNSRNYKEIIKICQEPSNTLGAWVLRRTVLRRLSFGAATDSLLLFSFWYSLSLFANFNMLCVLFTGLLVGPYSFSWRACTILEIPWSQQEFRCFMTPYASVSIILLGFFLYSIVIVDF